MLVRFLLLFVLPCREVWCNNKALNKLFTLTYRARSNLPYLINRVPQLRGKSQSKLVLKTSEPIFIKTYNPLARGGEIPFTDSAMASVPTKPETARAPDLGALGVEGAEVKNTVRSDVFVFHHFYSFNLIIRLHPLFHFRNSSASQTRRFQHLHYPNHL